MELSSHIYGERAMVDDAKGFFYLNIGYNCVAVSRKSADGPAS